MSHEIRTPLNAILGLAYLLARDPRDALQRERLAKIGDAGQHLRQIINDILDLSKIEADKLTLEETDFSLETLLASACVFYKQGAIQQRIDELRDGVEDRMRERHHGQRVLLAEDNIINRLVARELLFGVGLFVERAENGEIALELALSQSYDLILMGMQMPVMDGLDAARAIREDGNTAVPIIAMTANAFVEDRDACLAAGMNDHVAKPVNPAALYAMLLRWLPPRAAGGGAQTPS